MPWFSSTRPPSKVTDPVIDDKPCSTVVPEPVSASYPPLKAAPPASVNVPVPDNVPLDWLKLGSIVTFCEPSARIALLLSATVPAPPIVPLVSVKVPPANSRVAPADALNPDALDDPPPVSSRVPVSTSTVPVLVNGTPIVVPLPAVSATVPALTNDTVPFSSTIW